MKMIKIPEQLRDKKFRFIKLKKKDKVPIEKDWTTTANYEWDDPEMQIHLKDDNNYGVACGYGHLVVIDCDKEEIKNTVEDKLPETFTVKTGRGGYHFYYICEDLDKSIRLKESVMGDLGDVQWKGKQVVGPNSVHPNGNNYKVINDKPIVKVSAQKILDALSEYIIKNDIKVLEEEKRVSSQYEFDINITDVVSLKNLKKRGNEYQGPHPIHGSKNWEQGGPGNFSINIEKNVWHCFRHNTGGGPLSWIAVQEGIIKCEDATPGSLRKEVFNKVLDIASRKYNLKLRKDMSEISNEVLILLFKRKYNLVTEKIAKHILENEHIFTTRHDEKAEMWIYKDGIYIPQARTYINEYCREVLREAYNKTIANAVIAKIEADTYITQEEFFKEEPPYLIALKNGIFDIKQKKLLPFDPKYKFFNKIPVNYDENADCPKIKKFFRETLASEEDIKTMEEIFGFMLYNDYFLEVAIMLYGSGRNGKSKTLELMKRFIGLENVSVISLESIERDTFALSSFFKKKANLCGDLSKTALRNTGNFKSLTGRDEIEAQRKFKSTVKFKNYAKMIFSANELPITYDLSEAFWSRWIIIDFPYTFVSKEHYDEAIQEGKKTNNLKIADPDIIEKISTPEELSGLLNLALEGLYRLFKNKSFTKNPSAQRVKTKWLRMSDSCLAFIMDCIEQDFDSYITKARFRQEYSKYCRSHKLTMATDRRIKEVLTTNLGVVDDRKVVDNTVKRVWTGIKFKDNKISNTQLSKKQESLKKVSESFNEI